MFGQVQTSPRFSTGGRYVPQDYESILRAIALKNTENIFPAIEMKRADLSAGIRTATTYKVGPSLKTAFKQNQIKSTDKKKVLVEVTLNNGLKVYFGGSISDILSFLANANIPANYTFAGVDTLASTGNPPNATVKFYYSSIFPEEILRKISTASDLKKEEKARVEVSEDLISILSTSRNKLSLEKIAKVLQFIISAAEVVEPDYLHTKYTQHDGALRANGFFVPRKEGEKSIDIGQYAAGFKSKAKSRTAGAAVEQQQQSGRLSVAAAGQSPKFSQGGAAGAARNEFQALMTDLANASTRSGVTLGKFMNISPNARDAGTQNVPASAFQLGKTPFFVDKLRVGQLPVEEQQQLVNEAERLWRDISSGAGQGAGQQQPISFLEQKRPSQTVPPQSQQVPIPPASSFVPLMERPQTPPAVPAVPLQMLSPTAQGRVSPPLSRPSSGQAQIQPQVQSQVGPTPPVEGREGEGAKESFEEEEPVPAAAPVPAPAPAPAPKTNFSAFGSLKPQTRT